MEKADDGDVDQRHGAHRKICRLPGYVGGTDGAQKDRGGKEDDKAFFCPGAGSKVGYAFTAVVRPAYHGGKAEEQDGDRHEVRRKVREGCRIGRNGHHDKIPAVQFGGVVIAKNHEGGKRAEDDRIGKDLKNSPHALPGRNTAIGDGVGGGGGPAPRFVGDQPPHGAVADGGGEKKAEDSGGGGAGRKSFGKDLPEGGEQSFMAQNQHRRRQQKIAKGHQGDKFFGDAGHALGTAGNDYGGKNGKDGSGQHGGDPEHAGKGVGYGVDLKHTAHGKGVQNTQQGKGARRKRAGEAQTVGVEKEADVIHGGAVRVALGVEPSVAHGKHDFCVFEHHGAQGGDPHPEHCTGAAEPDCRRNAHDVADAKRARKRQRQRPERGDPAARFPLGKRSQKLFGAAEIKEFQPHAVKQSAENQKDGDRHPEHVPVQPFCHDILPFSGIRRGRAGLALPRYRLNVK